MSRKFLYSFLAVIIGLIVILNCFTIYFYKAVTDNANSYIKNKEYTNIEKFFSSQFSNPVYEDDVDGIHVRVYPSYQLVEMPVSVDSYALEATDGTTYSMQLRDDEYLFPYVDGEKWYVNGNEVGSSSLSIKSIDLKAVGTYTITFSDDSTVDYEASNSFVVDNNGLFSFTNSSNQKVSLNDIKTVKKTNTGNKNYNKLLKCYVVSLYSLPSDFATANATDKPGHITFVTESNKEIINEFYVYEGETSFSYYRYYNFLPAYALASEIGTEAIKTIEIYDGNEELKGTINLTTPISFTDEFFTKLDAAVEKYNARSKDVDDELSLGYTKSGAMKDINTIATSNGYNIQYTPVSIYGSWAFLWRMIVTIVVYGAIATCLGILICKIPRKETKAEAFTKKLQKAEQEASEKENQEYAETTPYSFNKDEAIDVTEDVTEENPSEK